MVTKKIKQQVLRELRALAQDIPIEWDRVSACNEYIAVFGWIARKKPNARDFVVYLRVLMDPDPWALYITSSAKYTKPMAANWEIELDHTPCRKFKEFFAEVK